MKNLIFACLGAFLVLGHTARGQEMVYIKGEVVGDTQGANKIELIGTDKQRDSAFVENGKFEFAVPYQVGMEPYLFMQFYMKPGKFKEPMPIVIDRAGTLNIGNIDVDKDLSFAKMSGIQSAVDFQGFHRGYFAIRDSVEQANPGSYASGKQLREPMTQFMSRYIAAHKNSLAAVYALDRSKTILDVESLSAFFDQLSAANKATNKGQELAKYIQALRYSDIGGNIAELDAVDAEGNRVSLAQFKGKYVLIDFWASWCRPCIKAFPYMKSLYAKYQGQNFEIIGITIDKKKDDWMKALAEHQLPWPQARDESQDMQKKLLVTAVPTIFLIDPDGNILLKEVGLNQSGNGPIEKKLAEIFEL